MVYIKITKIALSYPRFQFSFQGAFDTVESLAQATSSQHHPHRAAAGPAPSRSLGGPQNCARSCTALGGDHEDPPLFFLSLLPL